MFICAGEEQVSLPLENGGGPLDSSSPFVLDPDSIEGLLVACESSKSPSVSRTCTYVNEVPEEEKIQLEQKIFDLEGEINSLRVKQRSLDEKRREALNKILDNKGCIRVFCRVRPFSSTYTRRILQPLLVEPEKIAIRSAGSKKEFGFDKIFPQEASQEDVFVEVEPVLRSALDGHNICILAYGQTGTGKTFTMDGTNDTPGIVPRALEQLFHQASQDNSASFTFSISMLEVYLGNLRDLLAPKLSRRRYAVSKCNLNVQTDSKGSVEIEGLTELLISNCTKAAWWYTKGRRARSTSWTNVNEASSRSHCLTRITIYRVGNALGSKTEVSKLWMVDLGGSERLLKTGASGQTLDEGRAINLSLSALGDVIASLRRKKGHVPYRNSKLTQILRDSLGDGSKVLILVHISPYEDDVGETTCSFIFAKRARSVDTNRELPKELKMQKEKKISELEEVIRETVEECRKISNQIEKAEFLLAENKNLLSATHHFSEGEEKTPVSPPKNTREIQESLTSDKVVRKSGTNFAPRFMNPTVASRQRHNAAEKDIYARAKRVRAGTRSSLQISGFQSFSYSDPRFKASLQNSNKKSPHGRSNASPMDDTNCKNHAKPLAIQPSKVVTSSNPDFRATLGRHRRRMSDLI